MNPAPARIRIALAQIDPTVGDIDRNCLLAAEAIRQAKSSGAQLVVLPELTISGYPPEDLLLKPHFIDACGRAVATLAAEVEGIVALVGAPLADPVLRNGLFVLADGSIAATYSKTLLPNYGVFDERRYFEPGPGGELIELNGIKVGLTICEDIWLPGPPTTSEAGAGARLIVNASASPYHRGKGLAREGLVADRAVESSVPVALCNMVGGQDELVFDGHSVICDSAGTTLARSVQFLPEVMVCELELPAGIEPDLEASLAAPVIAKLEVPVSEDGPPLPFSAGSSATSRHLHPVLAEAEEVYSALVLGLGDYVHKNGFAHVVLGLSGGIDSALVALLAVDALGPERVSCVIMPSPHSSDGTQQDARQIAANLGCEAIELPIEGLMEDYESILGERFEGTEPGVAEENLQARIRGNLVMALSNKFGWLALTTGNKSEMSVGYATLYGDMAGGFAVIKDVPKTLVYELVADRNARAGGELIPASAIERPPSAELRPEQLDSDSLPPYEVLDPALEAYIERDGDREQVIASGIDPELADRVIGLVDRAEYKRRQAPPGVKITTKAFGRDRRQPITNGFGG